MSLSSPTLRVRGCHSLIFLLREFYGRPACATRPGRRYASTTTWNISPSVKHEATNIAVLGGGITGLATAYYLSKSLPNAKITLFEASSRLGGWLHSASVDVGNGKIVFEQGPRNLRPTMPNGLITLELVSQTVLRFYQADEDC